MMMAGKRKLWIGPLLFYWRQPSGLWIPKYKHRDLEPEYYENLHEEMHFSGMNFLTIQPWHSLDGLRGMTNHELVWKDDPLIKASVNLDAAAFRASHYRRVVEAPSKANLEDELWGPYWIERLERIPPERWLMYRGRRVMSLFANFLGWMSWPRDAILHIEDQLERHFGAPYLIRVTRNLTEYFEGITLLNNSFFQRDYFSVTPPTATVRPGFHLPVGYPGRSGNRYLPRDSGVIFKYALRTVLNRAPRVSIVDIESWNERVEMSYIEPCITTPREGTAYRPDDWGHGPRRYIKIIKREMVRRGRER